MDRAHLLSIRSMVVSALGLTLLLGAPLLAQADQGKWWKPKEGDRRVERRDRGWQGARDQGDRGNHRGWSRDGGNAGGWSGRRDGGGGVTWRDRTGGDRGSWRGGDRTRSGGGWSGGITYRDRNRTGGIIYRDRGRIGTVGGVGGITYRDRRYSGSGSWGGYSTWRGYPVRQDILVIRDQRYGGYFRARRLYCAPRYYGRFVCVRPIRYFIAADACIGPITIRAHIVRPHYLYGCNFCDARFETYDAYCQHVEHCDHRPGGCEISVSNWDDGYDSQWDGPYQTDDGSYDNGYNGDDEDDDGYYDN